MKLDTPVETYKVGKAEILVKRDDLMGDNKKLPPWGKLHALKNVIASLDDRPLIHLNVFGSWSGWALSKLAKKQEVHVVHPITKKFKPEYLDKVENAGGTLVPIRHNMMRVLYAQTGNIAKERGFQMLPYAFSCKEYLSPTARRISAELFDIALEHGRIDNLVVSSGAGVTVTALAKAFLRHYPKGKVYTICVSSEDSITKTLKQWEMHERGIHIVKSEYEFGDVMPKVAAPPFPCNQFWDKKAWHWLTENESLFRRKKTLFWNLGGEYTFL